MFCGQITKIMAAWGQTCIPIAHMVRCSDISNGVRARSLACLPSLNLFVYHCKGENVGSLSDEVMRTHLNFDEEALTRPCNLSPSAAYRALEIIVLLRSALWPVNSVIICKV